MRIGSILTLHRHRPRVLVSAGLLREVPALQRLAGLLGGLSSPLADRRGEPMSGNRLLALTSVLLLLFYRYAALVSLTQVKNNSLGTQIQAGKCVIPNVREESPRA